MPDRPEWPPPMNAAPQRDLLPEATLRFRFRDVRLLRRDGAYMSVVVPWILRVARRLDLHQIHIVHHPAVGADVCVLGEDIVDLGLLELGHDGVAVVRADRFD